MSKPHPGDMAIILFVHPASSAYALGLRVNMVCSIVEFTQDWSDLLGEPNWEISVSGVDGCFVAVERNLRRIDPDRQAATNWDWRELIEPVTA